MPLPIVLPTTECFPTGETHRLLSYGPNVSFTFVLIVEDVLAYTTAPLAPDVVERRRAFATARSGR